MLEVKQVYVWRVTFDELHAVQDVEPELFIEPLAPPRVASLRTLATWEQWLAIVEYPAAGVSNCRYRVALQPRSLNKPTQPGAQERNKYDLCPNTESRAAPRRFRKRATLHVSFSKRRSDHPGTQESRCIVECNRCANGG
jgi:hypothetical protein